MSNELDDLKRDYRAIVAPPYLATRIGASVADPQMRSGFWMPAAVTCTAIIALVLLLPFATNLPLDGTKPRVQPSMSALAALKPTKPAVPSPSLSQLRSLSVPRMPAKPRPTTAPQPQTNYQFDIKTLKEKYDAYI